VVDALAAATGSRLDVVPFPADMSDLPRWVARCLTSPSLAAWPPATRSGLQRLAVRCGELLAASPPRARLVHGDFNGKNLLVDDRGELTAVLDWEYAWSGAPLADIGNLLRFEAGAGDFAVGVASGYAEAGGSLPPGWRELAAGHDLFALVELAARTVDSPVVRQARAALRRRATAYADGTPD
jgi:aminoglycoside phosphotransferase (APT) family kinase protein